MDEESISTSSHESFRGTTDGSKEVPGVGFTGIDTKGARDGVGVDVGGDEVGGAGGTASPSSVESLERPPNLLKVGMSSFKLKVGWELFLAGLNFGAGFKGIFDTFAFGSWTVGP